MLHFFDNIITKDERERKYNKESFHGLDWTKEKRKIQLRSAPNSRLWHFIL